MTDQHPITPPSLNLKLLKEEALLILENLPEDSISSTEWNILYAALEQLPD